MILTPCARIINQELSLSNTHFPVNPVNTYTPTSHARREAEKCTFSSFYGTDVGAQKNTSLCNDKASCIVNTKSFNFQWDGGNERESEQGIYDLT